MFIRKDLKEIALTYRMGVQKYLKNNVDNLYKYIDAPRIVKFFAVKEKYGEKILDWEYETLEIILSREGMPYSFIEEVACNIVTMKHYDYVLTRYDVFEKAINGLIDDKTIDMDKVDFLTADEIITGGTLLYMLYGMDFKVRGETAREIVNNLQETGWTTLPAFISQKELLDLFDAPNVDNYEKLSVLSIKEIKELAFSNRLDSLVNYAILHLPIIKMLENTFKKIEKYTKF